MLEFLISLILFIVCIPFIPIVIILFILWMAIEFLVEKIIQIIRAIKEK